MKTQPIAISQQHSRRRQRSYPPIHEDHHNHLHTHDSSDSEQNYENDAKNFFCGSLNDLNSNMSALTVGSLPSSRRERRFIVSTGTNESICSRSNGSLPYPQGGGGGSLGGIGGALASSLPPPRAPFLSSRREGVEKMQNMPIMDLPESATDNGDVYRGAPQVIPYGSLRESRFHQRRLYHSPQKLQRHENGFEANTGDDHASGALPRSFSDDSFFPQSLPVDKYECNVIQKRWEKFNSSQEKPQSAATQDSNSENKVTSGIEKMLEDADKSELEKPIGNLSSQLEGLGNADKQDAGFNEPFHPLEIGKTTNCSFQTVERHDKKEGNFMSGLGRSLQSNGHKSSHIQQNYDDTFSLSHGTSSTNPHFFHGSITPNSSHLTPEHLGEDSENQLSSSLTGLDILEFAKKSPGGLSVDLTKEEKDFLMVRARTYSDDGPKILKTSSNITTRFAYTPPNNLRANEGFIHGNPPKLLPPVNLGGPQLLSPNNRHHNVYNSTYDGYRNGSISPQNPDTDLAFDLDFDE